MSKNIVGYVNYLFDLIAGDATILSRDKMRVAKGPDSEIFKKELKEFSSISVEETGYVVPGKKFAGISLCNRHLLLITNINEYLHNNVVEGLNAVEISTIEPHVGIFIALVKDASLGKDESWGEAYYDENIYSQQDDLSYDGHSYEDLRNCIEPFTLFEIGQNSLLYCSSHRVIAQFICSFFQEFRSLPLGTLFPSYQDLLLNGGPYLRKENIFNSLTSSHWRYSFLDLYRCIEALYALPRAISLKKSLNISSPGAQVARACIKDLGWRRQEEDSLVKLCRLLPKEIAFQSKIDKLKLFCGVDLDFSNKEEALKSYKEVGERIYKMRNSLVHHLDDETEFYPRDDIDWLIVIDFLLKSIKYIYCSYDAELRTS